MKKLLSIFLIAIMILASFSACASKEENETQNTTQTPVIPAPGESQTPTPNNNTNTQDNKENKGEKENQKESSTTDEAKFAAACTLITNGKIEEAYAALKELTNYAPAKEKLKNFIYAPTTVKNLISNKEETFEYNAYGDLLSMTNINGDKFSFTYDAKGNVLTGYSITSPSYTDPYIYSYKNGKLSSYTIGDTIKHTYEYNDKGYVSKIITENSYYNSTQETVYNYTYHENGAIKTCGFTDLGDGVYYIFEYNEKGQMIKQNLGEIGGESKSGYITISYNEYGYSKAEFFLPRASTPDGVIISENGEPLFIYECTYDRDGKLVDYRVSSNGEFSYGISYTSHQLCYVENPSTVERINIIFGIDLTTQLF